jgi:glycosyltransferase involved in cell wall biosynthesis
VVRAQPLFSGHVQPHLPAELGFYDLRVPEVREQQAAMARAFGIHGFCYYYYWFNGRRLLDRPLREMLESGRPDFPFCLCWANENWTRNWDGESEHILLEQKHSLASDQEFFHDVLPILQDPRYIRFAGKPVLLVYRVDKLPSPRDTARAWRDLAAQAGLPGLHLCAVETSGFGDPRTRGFDALVEFPPNSYATDNIAWRLAGMHPEFRGRVSEYRDMVAQSLAHQPEYPYHRAVMSMWDNTPRRHYDGTVFHMATPHAYEQWLRGHVSRLRERGEKETLVFINAWNEWGEGAHLEPDRHNGFAFLEATAAALELPATGAPAVDESRLTLAPAAAPVVASPAPARSQTGKEGWVLVVHDAHRHGAQYHALAIAREFQRRGLSFSVLLRQGGELESEFARCAELFHLPDEIRHYGSQAGALARIQQQLAAAGRVRCLGNTVVTGDVTAFLHLRGFPGATLVNELPTLIATYGFEVQARQAAEHSEVLVFPSDYVRRQFLTAYPAPQARSVIRPQGVLKSNPHLTQRARARAEVARRYSLRSKQQLVVTVGYGDLRKGPDLFLNVAKQVIAQPGLDATAFLWVGNFVPELKAWLLHDLEHSGLAGRVFLTGFQEDDGLYLAAADLFLLPSREDPFPNVMLSALEAGLPVVAFAGSGGADEALADGCGCLVPYLDTTAMAAAVANLLNDPAARRTLGERASARARDAYDFKHYVTDLLALLPVPGAGPRKPGRK